MNFISILFFSENPEKLSDFYSKVFQKDPDWSESGYYGFMVGQSVITIGPHDKVKGKSKNPERIMLNFETEDVKGEFERVKDIEGAEVIAEPYSPDEEEKTFISTLADPDGNFFQITSTWEEMSEGMENLSN